MRNLNTSDLPEVLRLASTSSYLLQSLLCVFVLVPPVLKKRPNGALSIGFLVGFFFEAHPLMGADDRRSDSTLLLRRLH